MAGLARRLAPGLALGGLAIVIVGVADPALAGRTDATATGASAGASTDSAATADQAGAAAPAVPTCETAEPVTGPSAMTPWGPVQVAATIVDGQLCEAHAVAWPANDRKSAAINSYAIPMLDQSASQSGLEFDYVSGATYTSDAYATSLQGLLDSL